MFSGSNLVGFLLLCGVFFLVLLFTTLCIVWKKLKDLKSKKVKARSVTIEEAAEITHRKFRTIVLKKRSRGRPLYITQKRELNNGFAVSIWKSDYLKITAPPLVPVIRLEIYGGYAHAIWGVAVLASEHAPLSDFSPFLEKIVLLLEKRMR
jgi:hypothetical protein